MTDSTEDSLRKALDSLSAQHHASRRLLDTIRTEHLVSGSVKVDTLLIQLALAVAQLESRIIALEGD